MHLSHFLKNSVNSLQYLNQNVKKGSLFAFLCEDILLGKIRYTADFSFFCLLSEPNLGLLQHPR